VRAARDIPAQRRLPLAGPASRTPGSGRIENQLVRQVMSD